MSSTIFALCCHILLYSRNASALRVASVDDYHTDGSVKCATITGNDGKKYACLKTCSSVSRAGSASRMGVKDCVKEINKNYQVVSYTGGSCSKYNTFTAKKCDDADRVDFYAIQGGIFGDPHVVNMAGEKFDILTSGTFSLLSLTRTTEEYLAINGTVVRFGTKCGQSFIDDLEFTGGWIREFYNTKTLKVRAVQATAQTEALQINFGQKWESLADLQEMARVKKTADAIKLDLSKLTIEVGAGKHKHHGWNFLNLDVQGLATLGDNIGIGGLLGYDDHSQVSQADADCAMFASTAETDTQDQQTCLSYLKAN